HFRRQVGRPLCGDWVELEETGDDLPVVRAIEPRRNHFARADANQRKQLVAANLDRVLIVVAPRPEPGRDVLERYLVAVHSLDIEPAIVVNKVELPEARHPPADSTLARIPDYESLGYSVVRTSCKEAPGVGALDDVIQGRTSILVGQSGVGKSSLINRLVPDLEVQTGSLSRATGKGRHTTTSTMMYALPDDRGDLIDSPGVWEFGLWALSQHELEHGFIEFRAVLGQCRFNDCAHDSEPDCAVKEAVQRGEILPWRYQAYCRLLQQY
ncbi:MAG: ribosome small subunit-dependent GTPase A, partial [Xanthomonadales bacterium]|nr:ribosome small subunit-dependent GTPase A [Xanthomonadales bacterium]